jgi:uncharacterized membrane protein YdjX (TVP38/TMEM64 family)
MTERQRDRARRRILNLTGCGLLLLSALVAYVLAVPARSEEIGRLYETYQDRLRDIEAWVLSVPSVAMLVAVILFLYALKSTVPIFPTAGLCFLTGVVFPIWAGMLVNIAGLALMMIIKYLWGRRFGGGGMHRLLRVHNGLRELLERDGEGNPWLLLLCRLVPSFPVNSVSQVYGAMGFGFGDYLIISLGGFMPKLVSYTVIGRNVFNPLSAQFLTPIIAISAVSGASVLVANNIISAMNREKNEEAGKA